MWGVLENHWRGELLTSIEKTLGLARSMTYRKVHPIVEMVEQVYEKGVSIAKKSMKGIEARLERKPDLPKWFTTIRPAPSLG